MSDRSRTTFGVSGLLAEGCSVFFATLFSPRHIGRVSDLLAARLEQAQADDLRVRALLLFSVYEAFRSRDVAAGTEGDPLGVECGIDGKAMAVGVTFTILDPLVSEILATETFSDRILAGSGKSEFESLLTHLCRHSNAVYLKLQPSTRRVELVSRVSVPYVSIEKSVLEVEILGDSVEEPPAPGEYIEIGDLDYSKLLREDSPSAQVSVPKTGKILVEALENRRVSGLPEEADGSLKINGVKPSEEGAVVKGVTENRLDEENRVEGVTQKIGDGGAKVEGIAEAGTQENSVSGDAPQSNDVTTLIKGERVETREINQHLGGGPAAKLMGPNNAEILNYQARIADLERQLAKSRSEIGIMSVAGPASASSSAAAAEALRNGEAQSLGQVIKRMFGIGEKAEPAPDLKYAQVGVPQAIAAVSTSTGVPPAGAAPAADGNSNAGDSGQGHLTMESVAQKMESQTGQLEATIAKLQREAAELKKELPSAKAKRFVDGMMSELVSEKARLHDFAKQLNVSARQKELEFRNIERGLQEDLKRKEELIRSKTIALERTKEQMAQVSLTVERMKSSGGSIGEDPHLKQKFAQNQRLLTVTKEENTKLNARNNELKTQLASLQLAAASSKGPSPQEFAALQNKYVQAQRLSEDYKRQTQLLMDKQEKQEKELKERPAAPLNDDIRKRLEKAMQMITGARKETDKTKLKVEELSREETRLKRELSAALAELKALKNAASGGAGGGMGLGSLSEAMNDAARTTSRENRGGSGEGNGEAA